METLADFGVASYFGIQTFSTGIYKAWLAMDNRIAAAQLAVLLLVVGVLLALEARAQKRLRFAAGRRAAAESAAGGAAWRGRLAAWAVLLPVLLGFVLPLAFMLRPLAADWSVLPWDRFLQWSFNSLRLGAISAALAVLVACCWPTGCAARRAGSRAAWCSWRAWATRCRARCWWWACCCRWAGCSRPGRKAASATG